MARTNDSDCYELATAFAAALAKHKKAELVTADTGFNPLETESKINWLK